MAWNLENVLYLLNLLKKWPSDVGQIPVNRCQQSQAFRGQFPLQIPLDSSYEHTRCDQEVVYWQEQSLSLSPNQNQIESTMKDTQRISEPCYHRPVLVYTKNSIVLLVPFSPFTLKVSVLLSLCLYCSEAMEGKFYISKLGRGALYFNMDI